MKCEKYMALGDLDKAHYLASLIHVCESDNELFEKGMNLIEEGREKGLFKNLKLGYHETYQQSNGENTSEPNS